jgi:hypothetical protein
MLVGERPDASFVATTPSAIAAVPPDHVRPIRQMDTGTAWTWAVANTAAGVALTMVAPLLAPITSLVWVGLLGDALLWFVVACAAVVSFLRAPRIGVTVLMAYAVLTVLALGLVPGTVGNLVRHRSTLIVPALLVVAAPVLAAAGEWFLRRIRRGAPAQTP